MDTQVVGYLLGLLLYSTMESGPSPGHRRPDSATLGSCGSSVRDRLKVTSPGGFLYDAKAPPGSRAEIRLADFT